MENEENELYQFGSAVRVSLPNVPRLPTDIRGLDRTLGGGFFGDKAHLIIGAPGAGKTLLACQLARSWASQGLPGLLVAEDPELPAKVFLQDNLTREARDSVSVVVGQPLDTLEVIQAWCDANPCKWIIVDSMPDAASARFSAQLQTLCKIRKVCGVLIIGATVKAINTLRVGAHYIEGDQAVGQGMACCIGITAILDEAGKYKQEQALYMYASRYSEDRHFPVRRSNLGFFSV